MILYIALIERAHGNSRKYRLGTCTVLVRSEAWIASGEKGVTNYCSEHTLYSMGVPGFDAGAELEAFRCYLNIKSGVPSATAAFASTVD